MIKDVFVAIHAQSLREKKRIILRFLRSFELGRAYWRFRYSLYFRNFSFLASEIESMWLLAYRYRDIRFMTSIWLYEERLGRYVESIKHEYASFVADRGDPSNLSTISHDSLIWLRIKEFDNEGIGNGVLCLGLVKQLSLRVSSISVEVDNRLLKLWRRTLAPHSNITVYGFRECTKPAGFRVVNQTELKFLLLDARSEIHYTVLNNSFLVDQQVYHEVHRAMRQLNPELPVVGLVWKSKNPGKGSLRLDQLKRLISTFSATYVILQYGATQEEISVFDSYAKQSASSVHWGNRNLSGDLDYHFAEIAAVDVVITIASSVAYFATALGVRSFVLVDQDYSRQFPIWGSETPWHPSSHIIHQGCNGFDDSIAEVVGRLSSQDVNA